MQIKLTSLMVDDQSKALAFYTGILGFLEKQNFPAGSARWISVVSPESPDGVQLSLEPNSNPAGKAFQKAMFEQRIPVAAFEVRDLQAEFARLSAAGVAFVREPMNAGPVSLAIFSDTCGNLLQIYQLMSGGPSSATTAPPASAPLPRCSRAPGEWPPRR